MILILKTDIMDPVMQCTTLLSHSESLKRFLFHFSRRSTHFYRLSHSEIVDIEKVAVRSSLRLPNNKCALIESRANENLYAPFGILFDPKWYYKDNVCTMNVAEAKIFIRHMALPPRDQRHQYLRYEGLQYTNANVVDFEMRLAKIYRRRCIWFRLFEIRGPLVHELLLEFFSTFRFREAVLDLDTTRALHFQLGGVRRHISWREFILALGLHIAEEIQTAGFGLYWAESVRQISDKGDLSAYWVGISSAGDFLGIPPSYTLIRDPMLRLCHRLIACSIARRIQAPKKVTVADLFYLRGMDIDSVNIPYLLARYLRLFASGRKQGAMISGGQFIYEEIDDTWAWVAPGPERHQVAVAGAPKATEDTPKGTLAIPAPVQAPQPPPPVAGLARTMAQRLRRLEEEM
ncbi:hypothetical protein Tco_0601030 [Tanacetum coccineum]